MITATASLIQNNIVIVFFLPILYRKTNVDEGVQVFKTFEILNTWFTVLKTTKQELPNTFDYDLFLDGIFKALNSDEAVSVEKVLWFMYYNYGF